MAVEPPTWMSRLNIIAFFHPGAGTVAQLMDMPIPMVEAMERELPELLKMKNG